MKKLFSAILASLLILSTLSFVASAAGDPIVVSPSQLNVNVDKDAGMTRTITTKDGLPVIKMEPVTSSGDCFRVDGYNIGSRNVTISDYKYVSMDYYYETSLTDSASNPILGTKAAINMLQLRLNGTNTSREFTSDEVIVANRWARVTFNIASIAANGLTNNSDGNTHKQYHLYPLGRNTKGNTANGTIYINNLTFHTEPVGIPTITSVQFAKSEIEIEKGYSMSLPEVKVVGENGPMQDVTYTVAGHSSASTILSNGSVYVGEDETATSFTVTATSIVDPDKSAVCTVKVKNPAPRTEFDADNVVVRFGVVSDVHQNGYYGGAVTDGSAQEWSHVIDVFQQTAKDDGAVLDAIVIDGDMTDGISNNGSNVGSFNSYGDKAMQNMREVTNFAKGVWGKNNGPEFTETKKVIDSTKKNATGYTTATSVVGRGNGFDATTRLFYSLGNHDESGRGKSTAPTKNIDGKDVKFSAVYSADYFAAIICGWQHNPDSDEAKTNSIGGTGTYQDGFEHSYRNYIADLIDYNTNANTTVTATSFESKYGVKLSSADALFDQFYGHLDLETTLTDKNNGLSLGNMHMTIDPDKTNGTTDDRLHFIAVELSQSNDSCAWAEAIIKTSIEENPAKPIFVFTHYKMPNSMYGGDESSITRLHNVIKNYPQVIIWGGHSHTTMHNDNAINTELGYVAVETNTTRYLSTSSGLTLSSKYGKATVNSNADKPHTPFNYSGHEAAVSNGIYVEVDKNNNVRLNRVDIYRSYSTMFAQDTGLYTQSKYTNFNNHAYNPEFKAVNEVVFIREPWDITDIGTGKHLSDFNTSTRTQKTGKPYFENVANTLKAESVIGGLDVTFTMNAKDDGMVMLYVLEVKDAAGTVVHRRYYTNFYYEYPQNPTATYAGNMLAEKQYTANVTGLNPATEYTVELFAMDDFYVAGEPIAVKATTKDGNTKIALEDGRVGVFVDITGATAEYKHTDGKTYLVYSSFASAIAAEADVVYYIKGDVHLQDDVVKLQTKDLEIIGVGANRTDTMLHYQSSVYCTKYSLTLRNVGVNKENSGDCAFHCTNDLTITLDNVLATNYGFNLFGGGHSNDAGGNIVIKGDTGPVNSIYTGVASWQQGHHVGGDIDVIIEGGKFTGTVGNNKNQTNNYIDGNVRITITGGTFGGTVAIGSTDDNSAVKKNAVLTILGGDLTNAKIGRTTSATKVSGKDIIITTAEIKKSAGTFNKASNGIVILVPADKTDAIGAETVDANGYITEYAINQVEGKTSYVNGVAATKLALTAGETYEITYKTANAIEFNLNGGTGTAPATINGNAGDVVTALPAQDGFERTNYTFKGWALTPDATEAVSSITITAEGVIAYAVWEPKPQAVITLNANGGTSEASVTVFQGEETLLPTASKPKAAFLGWAESADATTGTLKYTVPVGTTAVTLYAIYNEVGMDIIYVDTTAAKNGDGKTSATPMNDWKKAMAAGSADGTMYVLMTTTIVSKSSTVGSDFGSAKGPFTLTATDPATGVVYNSAAVFSTNGHYSKQSVTYDIPVAAIDHTGMHINASGYNTYFTKNAKFIAKGEAIPGLTETASANIYIRGRGENGTVTSTYYEFDDVDVVTNDIRLIANGSSKSTTSTVVINGGANDKKFSLGSSNTYGTLNVIVNGFSGTGKTITLDAAATINVMNLITNNDTANNITFSYTAVPSTTYIIKSTSEGKVMPTATAGTFEITTEEDNIFANGVKLTKSADNRYALGAAGTYVITYDQTPRHTVTYKANGGEGADVTATLKEGASINLATDAAAFTKTGYKLVGWNTDANATTALTALEMGTADVTLYAVWEEIKHLVSFDANGAEGTAPAAMNVREGAEIVLPTEVELTMTGFSFLGWNTDKDATEALSSLTMGKEDITLYAIWKEKLHKVTYDVNGGEGTAPEAIDVREGLAIALPTEVAFTKAGHTFMGWAESADATQALASLTMGTADVTLYAVWAVETYKVTFNANGGNVAGTLADMTKTYGVDLTLPTDYILYGTGLEFAGWSVNPDADASEVVTVYTENAPADFFAIYNKVGTDDVTNTDELAEGTYLVMEESEAEIEAPAFDIPGTVKEVAKYDITLMNAVTGEKTQPASHLTFTIHCDEEAVAGKAVYVYHVCDEPELLTASVNGGDVTFKTEHLSTFVVYTVEVEASYILNGQYNNVSGLYTVSLFYNGVEANSGSFGFAYDADVYTFDSFAYAEGFDAVIETAYDEEASAITGTWYPTSGAYVGGNDEDILVGTFTFTCALEDYDMALASDRFFEFKDAEVDDETFNGEYYLYAPNKAGDLNVTFAPIVTLAVVDAEPITVTYEVTASLVTERADGDAPVSFAKAIITTATGSKVAEFAIEDEATATGTVEFTFEMAPGTFNLTVIKNGYLETTVEFTVAEEDLDLGDIAPVAGDIRGNEADAQGDGVIDLADFVRVLRGFEFEELASHVDINEDGVVNVTDLGFVKANFAQTK
ncbi:MAG: InlB B-repeat-containing protein [Clostridia bacterium]|nr:InlB B-repeat-containing protein [Clostridia bacterium]